MNETFYKFGLVLFLLLLGIECIFRALMKLYERRAREHSITGAALILALSLVPAQKADAQFGGGVVVCPSCASQVTAAAQLGKDIEIAEQGLAMSQQLIQSGKTLTHMQWSNATSDLMNIAQSVQIGQGLAYSAANLDAQFARAFPGIVPPPSAQLMGYYGMYQKWSNTAMQSIQGALRGTGMSYQQLVNQQLYLSYLRGLSGSSVGQMQAIQAGNQIGIAQINALGNLQSLMMADMQAKTAVQAYTVQNDMTARQLEDKMFGHPQPTPRDGFGLTSWP